MTDRYAVWGNPIAHSQSPWIHAEFRAQLGEDISYEALLGDLDRFEDQVRARFDAGYRGFNITLPFKTRALSLAQYSSEAARLAEAANTLVKTSRGIEAHNTDGVGLYRDLERLGVRLAGIKILVLGAGGATRGILEPLLRAGAEVMIANRTMERAESIAARFNDASVGMPIQTLSWQVLAQAHPNAVINATSTGLSGDVIPIPESLWANVRWAYDLAYTPSGITVFTENAEACGVPLVSDGLGMLVEQAAEAYEIWRGVRPQTAGVREALRSRLQQQSMDDAH